MRSAFISFLVSVTVCTGFLVYQGQQSYGAAISETALTDTLGTFRTNVNSSLKSLVSTSAGTTSANIFNALNTFQASTAFPSGVWSSTGYVGVGTTTPFRPISVTDGGGKGQVAIAYDTTKYSELRTDSSGDFNMDGSGSDIYVNNSNFWVCTGGSFSTNGCPSGNPSGQGNLIVENRIGLGTTTPQTLFQISAGGSATSTFTLGALSTGEKSSINMRTNLGAPVCLYVVGTTLIVEAGLCK